MMSIEALPPSSKVGSYRDQLLRWCVLRVLPSGETQEVIRFRRHSDAEARVQILRRTHPEWNYTMGFDAPSAEQV